MKTIISTTALMLLFMNFCLFSQNIVIQDDIYVDKDGKPFTGKYKEYYSDGILKFEIELVNGTKNGKGVLYFENGSIQAVYSYKLNQMDGLWLTYNSKNIKTAEANYLKDKKDGSWKIWDENGKLVYEMLYKNGEKAGSWIKYNDKGDEIARKSFN